MSASAITGRMGRRTISLCYVVDTSKLGLEGRDGLVEHAAERIRPRGGPVRAYLGERQLERPPLRVRLTFRRRQRAADSLRALSFSLLKLDVLALEAASHSLQVF
jgi:hypothetical protein